MTLTSRGDFDLLPQFVNNYAEHIKSGAIFDKSAGILCLIELDPCLVLVIFIENRNNS